MSWQRAIFLALLLVGIVVAACVDAPLATWIRNSGVEQRVHDSQWPRELIKLLGYFPVTLLIALIIGLKHRTHWRGALFLTACGLAAAANYPLKWLVGRVRPFKTLFEGPIEVARPFALHPLPLKTKHLLSTPNLSFPSGHAALAFATATGLSILLPRWRWAFYLLAVTVGCERIVENAHWCSDVVCGAALGVAGAKIVEWIAWRNGWAA